MATTVPAASSTPAEPAHEAGVSQRRPIRRLDPLLVNQIAAGEVVERPASVVKELVENALDAGARRIIVELEQGGIELVRVSDDGGGIPESELALAVAPHATSKVGAPEDLDRIATMGFRGEALASIASVSRLSIRSRTKAQTGASIIEIEGATVQAVRPASGPVGTSVSVRNLFFNTPARRKFLRTVATEQGHCVDAACALALARPGVGFTITCDGRTVLDVPADQPPGERALDVLGRELDGQFLELNPQSFSDSRRLAIWGLVGLPSIARASAKCQHVFLNGRPIRDKVVQHALREAYRGLIEPGRYPTAIVMLEMDPSAVDVNVHPAKTEVRFRDQSLVHSGLLLSVREVLRRADLTPSVHEQNSRRDDLMGPGALGAQGAHGAGANAAGSGAGPSPAGFVEFFTSRVPASVNGRFEYQAVREAIERVVPGLSPSVTTPGSTATTQAAHDSVQEVSAPASTSPSASSFDSSSPDALPVPVPKERVLQVHNSYVVTQDEQGLVIVDQHALHERVMFEALLARVGVGAPPEDAKPLESQTMLMPAQIGVSRASADRLDELASLLDRIGVKATRVGPESVAVSAFPTFLFERGVDCGEFVAELLDRASNSDFVPTSEEALHEVLDMMACKAAVKAGDRMSELELADLLKLRSLVERSSNCPHGRPTSIRLTIRELEKRFGRA